MFQLMPININKAIISFILIFGVFILPLSAKAIIDVAVTNSGSIYGPIVDQLIAIFTADTTTAGSTTTHLGKKITELLEKKLKAAMAQMMKKAITAAISKIDNDIFKLAAENVIKNFEEERVKEQEKVENKIYQKAQEAAPSFLSKAKPEFRPILEEAVKQKGIEKEMEEMTDCTTKEKVSYLNPACFGWGAILLSQDISSIIKSNVNQQLNYEEEKKKCPFKDVYEQASVDPITGRYLTKEGKEQRLSEADLNLVMSGEQICEQLKMIEEQKRADAGREAAALTSKSEDLNDAILNMVGSFVDQFINQGMAAFNNLLTNPSQFGPSSTNPNTPLPPDMTEIVSPEKNYDLFAKSDLSASEELNRNQKLLNENLIQNYLREQQNTLNLLVQIKTLQKNILNLLKDLYLHISQPATSQQTGTGWSQQTQCQMPSWAEVSEKAVSNEVSTTTPEKIVKISIYFGSISFYKKAKTIISVDTSLIDQRVEATNNEIKATQEQISSIKLAISAVEKFVFSLKDYLQPAPSPSSTAGETAAPTTVITRLPILCLVPPCNQPENQKDTITLRKAAIELSQKSINSKVDNFFLLDADTQMMNLDLVKEINNIILRRGSPIIRSGLYGEIDEFSNKANELNQQGPACFTY